MRRFVICYRRWPLEAAPMLRDQNEGFSMHANNQNDRPQISPALANI
jgi:hypothetical protein